MEILSEKTVNTIREHIDYIEVELPLKSEDDICTIFEYFVAIEIGLANDLDSGIKVDRRYLNKAANVVTELSMLKEDVDLDDLNGRLLKDGSKKRAKKLDL